MNSMSVGGRMDGIEAKLLGARRQTVWLPEAKLLRFMNPRRVEPRRRRVALGAKQFRIGRHTVWPRDAKQCRFGAKRWGLMSPRRTASRVQRSHGRQD